jgi:hypothetical protein
MNLSPNELNDGGIINLTRIALPREEKMSHFKACFAFINNNPTGVLTWNCGKQVGFLDIPVCLVVVSDYADRIGLGSSKNSDQ